MIDEQIVEQLRNSGSFFELGGIFTLLWPDQKSSIEIKDHQKFLWRFSACRRQFGILQVIRGRSWGRW